MPGLSGPPIAVAAYLGDSAEIKRLVDTGADVMEPTVFEQYPHHGGGLAIHQACHFGDSEALAALLSADTPAQLNARNLDSSMGSSKGLTPLMIVANKVSFVWRAGTIGHGRSDYLKCAQLLLDAGVDLHPRTPSGERAVDLARKYLKGKCKAQAEGDGVAHCLVELLERAEALRYSAATHRSFPKPARDFARSLLMLGRNLVQTLMPDRAFELLEVWAAHVMPKIVSRSSRITWMPKIVSRCRLAGAHVIIDGLKSRPKLNGQAGKVCPWCQDATESCAHVQINGLSQIVAVPLANLHVNQDASKIATGVRATRADLSYHMS